MSSLILCGPCGYAKNIKNAEKMCTVCEEGLCAECEKVHKSIQTTRNHKLISTEDYQQIKQISVSLNCEDHDKRFELYCKTHDVAVCLGCVTSHHRTCSDVIPLERASANAKQSTALADLEDTLTVTIRSLEQIIADRDSEAEMLENQRQTIKNTINDTRGKIMNKLADLEQKLLHELDLKHDDCKSEERKLLTSFNNSKRDLTCLREQTLQLKSFASDIQLFLGTRQINEAVYREVESVKERIKCVQIFEINLMLNPYIMALMNELDQFGKISVRTTTTNLPFKEAKVDQAQIELRVSDFDNVSFQLNDEFEVRLESLFMWLSGCTLLQNGNLLIADYNDNGKPALMEYSQTSEQKANYRVRISYKPCSSSPFDLTVIDTDRIAVTYGNKNYLEILNMKSKTVEKEIKFEKGCYGISYQDSKLYIITGGIVITDIAGNVLKTFRVDCGKYLKATKDRIYFTKQTSINCISMTGETIWEHTKKSSVDLRGITVDDHQNVFVIDKESNTIIGVRHDGQCSRHVLTETDGLRNPSALHYNKDKKILLVCNMIGDVILYNLVK